jgi:monofunctional biosynthetic peptidoglycan transglycosylase
MIKFLIAVLVALGSIVALVAIAVAMFLVTTPQPKDIKGCLTTKLYHIHLCPKDSTYVKISAISKDARNAVVVSEDGAFYTHHGFDWDEMHKSFETDMEKGEFSRGGSTITQQLAKNVYLSNEKSLIRKVREALITVQLEDELSKDEILEKYLNVVEFGPNLYGIGPAAQYYFKKSPAQLTPAEGAWLAFLLPNPKKYSVSFRSHQLTRFARRQVSEIVDRLYRFKKITDDERAVAMNEVDTMFGSPAAPIESATAGSDEVGPDESTDESAAPANAPPPAEDAPSENR